MMRVLDLFSGIGGFSLGLEAAGMKTVAFCEQDKFCQAVLRKHWPDVPCHDDVKTLDGKDYYGRVDLICGGYPCQPFSVAGKQLGHEDERHLWPEMFRIIQGAKPRWVVAENVAGHISLGFDEVAASLEAEGFTVWPFVIPACAVNAPHRRDRVWIVGYSKHNGLSSSTFAGSPTKASNNHAQGEKSSSKLEGASRREHDENVAYANGTHGERTQQPKRSKPGHAVNFKHGWWKTEPDVGRVANGVPSRSHRLKALGNAVVPQIAEIIGKAIMQAEGMKS